VEVTCQTPAGPDVVRASWLVAADGAARTVRELLGLPFDGFTWPDRFVSTNIRYDFTAAGLPSANWRIDSAYGAVIARIDRTDLWRYTFREPDSLPLEGLEERIHEHFKRGLYGGDYELVQYAPYRMHQRCTDSFHHGRVVLAGDAARRGPRTGAGGPSRDRSQRRPAQRGTDQAGCDRHPVYPSALIAAKARAVGLVVEKAPDSLRAAASSKRIAWSCLAYRNSGSTP
jgi:hypothetical protein